MVMFSIFVFSCLKLGLVASFRIAFSLFKGRSFEYLNARTNDSNFYGTVGVTLLRFYESVPGKK